LGWLGVVESSLVTDLGAPAAAAAIWVRPGNVVRHPGASGLERASLGPGVHLAESRGFYGLGLRAAVRSMAVGRWKHVAQS